MTAGQLAEPGGQTALNRDLPDFASGGKPDEITAGRPERRAGSVGAVDGPGSLLIEILDPQLSLRARVGKGDVLSIGGDGDMGVVAASAGSGADGCRRREGKSAQEGFGGRFAEMDK